MDFRSKCEWKTIKLVEDDTGKYLELESMKFKQDIIKAHKWKLIHCSKLITFAHQNVS